MKTILCILSATTLCASITFAEEKVISGVPSYTADGAHGCGPAAIGDLLGYYWIQQKYYNLFSNPYHADPMLTSTIQNALSSTAHNSKYDPTPDNAALPAPPNTSIADFLGTSVDPLQYGVSYPTNSSSAIIGYTNSRGYTFQTSTKYYSTTWNALVSEIDAGRPVLFFVDDSGTGIINHAIPVFGYDSNHAGDGAYYACYTTASEDEVPIWKKFRGIAVGNSYGVYGCITINPGTIPYINLTILDVGIKQPQNVFEFTITGFKNATVTVEACTDLSSWAPIGTCLLNDSGQGTFTDASWTSFANHFYRAKWP